MVKKMGLVFIYITMVNDLKENIKKGKKMAKEK